MEAALRSVPTSAKVKEWSDNAVIDTRRQMTIQEHKIRAAKSRVEVLANKAENESAPSTTEIEVASHLAAIPTEDHVRFLIAQAIGRGESCRPSVDELFFLCLSVVS